MGLIIIIIIVIIIIGGGGITQMITWHFPLGVKDSFKQHVVFWLQDIKKIVLVMLKSKVVGEG